jgi:hypothetical protein
MSMLLTIYSLILVINEILKKNFLIKKHKNSLTCLILKTLSYKKLLEKIIRRSKMLEREKFLGEKLAHLLVYDVLFGRL